MEPTAVGPEQALVPQHGAAHISPPPAAPPAGPNTPGPLKSSAGMVATAAAALPPAAPSGMVAVTIPDEPATSGTLYAPPGPSAPGAEPTLAGDPLKRALLIGINYVGQAAELSGCVNDVMDMRALCVSLGYGEICVLYDGKWPAAFDQKDARLGEGARPTRANIAAGFRWLVTGAGRGDMLLLHYSGHGGQLRALVAGSEETGMDDTIVPVDYETAGMMRDDEIRSRLIDSVRASGATLRAFLDCCHSGTGMDLKYNLSLAASPWDRALAGPTEQLTAASPEPAEAQIRALVAKLTAEAVRAELKLWFGETLVEKYMGPALAAEEKFTEWTLDGVETTISGAALASRAFAPRLRTITPDILMISGCTDSQTSADAVFKGRAGGALTHYILEVLRQLGGAPSPKPADWPTAVDLLRELRKCIRMGGFHQTPQLSSESPLTAQTRFNLL